MCTFADQKIHSISLYIFTKTHCFFFLILYNTTKQLEFSEFAKVHFLKTGVLGRGDEKEKIEVQNQRYRSRRNVL